MSNLKWRSKTSTPRPRTVVIAVNPYEVAEEIIQELKSLPDKNYEDIEKWEFLIAPNKEAMDHCGQPDVLVLWRNLQGFKKTDLMKYAQEGKSHLVHLIGEMDAEARDYMKFADSLGLNNFVIGDLPGEPPYTLDVAIEYTVSQIQTTGVTNHAPIQTPYLNDPAPPVTPKVSTFNQIIKPAYSFHPSTVIPISEKGGIGKTTTCCGTAAAAALGLPNNNIIVLDLGVARDDVITFFNSEPSPYGALEVFLENDPSPEIVRQIMVQSKTYPNIYIVPGPRNEYDFRAHPFNDRKITRIIESVQQVAATMGALVFVDMPSIKDKPWTPAALQRADFIITVLNQSDFASKEEKLINHGEFLSNEGVNYNNLRIVINSYDPGLSSIRIIHQTLARAMGVKPASLKQPITIPHTWVESNKELKKSRVVGLDDPKSPWYRLAKDIAETAGLQFVPPEGRKTNLLSSLKSLFVK